MSVRGLFVGLKVVYYLLKGQIVNVVDKISSEQSVKIEDKCLKAIGVRLPVSGLTLWRGVKCPCASDCTTWCSKQVHTFRAAFRAVTPALQRERARF